jgi:hypothetical protein
MENAETLMDEVKIILRTFYDGMCSTCHSRWSNGSVLAIGPKIHGLKPGQGRWIFKGYKNP